jgi:hypothetical protein
MSSYSPPGWPDGVPPPGAPGWQERAVLWLLDQCPPEYRGHSAWRRHPVALAWLAVRHVEGQQVALREAWREARVELGPHLPPSALTDVLGQIEAEGIRLVGVARSAHLLHGAFTGEAFAPRL